MKRLMYGLSGVLLLTALVCCVSCGSSWEISGNTMNVEVMKQDSIVKVPAGSSVFCVDTPSGAMKCYAIPQ